MLVLFTALLADRVRRLVIGEANAPLAALILSTALTVRTGALPGPLGSAREPGPPGHEKKEEASSPVHSQIFARSERGVQQAMMRSAEEVRDESGRQYHIDLAPGEVAPAIILVGDPKRAERVASFFDEVTIERRNREFVTLTGVHKGLAMTVMGTGMGAGSTEIAVIELCQCVDDPVMIRCGSSGALQPGMQLGDLVITQGALRMEAASLHFVDPGYPAVADPQVMLALAQAAEEVGRPVHMGITATAPGFYGAQGRRIPGFPPRDPGIVDRLASQGVRNLEMEASTLLTLASLRRFAAGAVCAVYATRVDNKFIEPEAKSSAELACIQTGLRAQHILAAMASRRGKRALWHPALGLDESGSSSRS